ncbi:beta-lactamase/transpeptidase-like protein [Lindgomyces ingoldianus]|uniref:Beta-lactamase/transpeptidase-like protein n=1 Tax=Lindgomyces ingoldianus TaxID=673940 RepID=A0ACB6QA31_9PLEO|nr:beta-lactamase/transpeptidase-like protein [Lindgomyces ingoldianus]KAF2463771.1 beta-lactamase/transpeptidase-like protein [Lindgomyces ingoldianus]
MDNIKSQLQSLHPEISKILAISGSPALSLGVLHQGRIVHTAHFGRRNEDDLVVPTDKTIYWIGSLTKIITATAVARLVHEAKLDWDVPIREYLPVFRVRQDEIGLKATLRDLLSCRTGITPANSLWNLQYGETLIPKSETSFTATYLDAVKPFREGWVYSQWNYTLVSDVVEAAGTPLCEYIEETLFHRLGMSQSSFAPPHESNPDVANAHGIRNDGTPSRIPNSNLTDAGAGPAAGAKSSIRDLLTFLSALLSAHKHQKEKAVDATPGSPFAHIRPIFEPQIGFGPPGRSRINDAGYCMGLYRTRLPGYLSVASPNFTALGRKRLVQYGMQLRGMEVYHHAASIPGHFGAMYLVPSMESAVVVLTNSQPLVDPADFAAQLVLSVLLDEKPSVDFVKMADLGRSIAFEGYKQLAKAVEEGKTDKPPSKPLVAYEGDYFNAIHNFVLSVAATGDGLSMVVQRKKTGFVLLPYDGDTFYWPVDREDEVCNKAMWPFTYPDWHRVYFESNANGAVERLIWRHDPYLLNPEVFTKTPKSAMDAKL